MTLDPLHTEPDYEDRGADVPALMTGGAPAIPTATDHRGELPDITPDLVERLARQLAESNGDDPDAQPRPLRFPLWRYHRGRAKTLLTISPMELRALARVMGVTEPDQQRRDPWPTEPPYLM